MQAQPQMASVLTPSGQIQQIQIASLANVQVNNILRYLIFTIDLLELFRNSPSPKERNELLLVLIKSMHIQCDRVIANVKRPKFI